MNTAAHSFDPDGISRELDVARRKGPLQVVVIPSCPFLLGRLRELLAAPEPDLGEVARTAASDVAMAATLINVANSARFGAQGRVQTLGQALNRLGLQEMAQTMLSYQLRRAIRVTSPHLKGYWERSTQRASIMSHIARHTGRVDEDVAFTFGLFCDVGRPVMMQSLPGYAGTLVEAAARIDRSPIATENANHRTDHAVVGALVARVWGLAPAVMAAIRRHHDLDMLGQGEANPEVHTLVAGGLIADHLIDRREGLPESRDWQHHHHAALEWLEVSVDDLHAWEEDLGHHHEAEQPMLAQPAHPLVHTAAV